MRPQEIAKRAHDLGLQQKALAKLSGLHRTHVGQVLNDDLDPRQSTLDKLQEALIGAELEQVRRLAKLHPQAALEAATVAMCPQQGKAAA